MTAPLKTIEGSGDIAAVMRTLGCGAKAAARALALAPAAQKDAALAAMAQAASSTVMGCARKIPTMIGRL